MAQIQQSQDDTVSFISKTNLQAIVESTGKSQLIVKQAVMQWLKNNQGYVPSLTMANQAVIQQLQGTMMAQRPFSASQDTQMSMDERMRILQQDRDSVFKKPPMFSNEQFDSQNNTITAAQKDEFSKKTAQRLEMMQRERSQVIQPSSVDTNTLERTQSLPISQSQPPPQSQPRSSVAQPALTLALSSKSKEVKKGSSWWEAAWNIPQIYTLAMASKLEVPSCFLRFKLSVQNIPPIIMCNIQGNKGGGQNWVLTPSLTHMKSIIVFRYKSHFKMDSNIVVEYESSDSLDWNQKVDRIEASIQPAFEEDVIDETTIKSWNIISKWYR